MKNKFILFLMYAVIFVVCLEFLTRHFIFDPNSSYIRTPGWAIDVKHNDLLPFVTTDHTISINRYGYRGALPGLGADPFIFVTGGSTAEDWVLPESATWAEQLESRLKVCYPTVEVANLGKGGANARHNIMQLDAASSYMPASDVYVVLLGLNDFLFDLHIHHPFQVSDDWWKLQSFMTNAGDEGRFAIVALLKRLYKLYNATGNTARPVSDFGDYQKGLRDARDKVASYQWVDILPDLSPHLENYKNTILKLKALADSQGADIFFLSQPFVWSPHMSHQTQEQLTAGFIGGDNLSPQTRWYTPRALEEGLTAYNDTLRETCKTAALNCIDVARKLPRQAKYFYDDFHFSNLGASTVAKFVAEGMQDVLKGCR